MKEEVETPPIHVRSMYTKQYAKHGGTISKAKEASAKAYDAVEKMHGKEMRDKLQAFHAKNMKEEKEQGIPKKKEEKFHMKLDKLVHKTFGSSPEEKMKKEEVEQIDEVMAQPNYNQSIKARQEKADKDLPFTPDPPKKKSVVAGKHGEAYSRVRHLARQALKKQSDKLKPVKESLDESRKTEIVREVMKKKKNDKDNAESFEKDPVLSSEIVKA